jgi:hypothetical protein
MIAGLQIDRNVIVWYGAIMLKATLCYDPDYKAGCSRFYGIGASRTPDQPHYTGHVTHGLLNKLQDLQSCVGLKSITLIILKTFLI